MGICALYIRKKGAGDCMDDDQRTKLLFDMAERIRSARETLRPKRTQLELANDVDISLSTYQRIENPDRDTDREGLLFPRLDELIKICKSIDLPPEELFELIWENPPETIPDYLERMLKDISHIGSMMGRKKVPVPKVDNYTVPECVDATHQILDRLRRLVT